MKLLAVYDNGGETFDRYTAVYDSIESHRDGVPMYLCLGMSEHPSHPQGFGQHGSCMLGDHLGKKINFHNLPKECRQAVMSDIF